MDDELESEIVEAMCVAYDRAMIKQELDVMSAGDHPALCDGGMFPMKDALAAAKPMIERGLLRALQNVAAGMPPEMQAGVHDAVDIVSEARGIDLEAE